MRNAIPSADALNDIFRKAVYDYFALDEDRRTVPEPGDFLRARECGASPRLV
jgi:hypothetical protein